ncbi:MAG TPA: 1-deoxy-D-xylulose-5-phosphate reductoisomerase, partial [Lentisphaeria bacterium]|nr:1-deoxy-D-xylulose-5-phosphate reductoisomerase [Lentisphaeria bacterium]
MQKRLVILGSTGSIGTSAIRVIEHAAGRFQVTGLAAGRRTNALAAQARALQPAWVYASDAAGLAAADLPPKCRTLRDEEALCEAVSADDVDIVLCAIVGTAGLKPVLAALAAG